MEARLRELLPDDRVTVLENTRFNPGETKNDEGFARELAEGCDLYVNDAFGSAHRAHSSTEAVAHLLPAYAGLLLLDELEHLGRLLGDVERPFVLISGGAKVEDKLGVLRNLGGAPTRCSIGGKMAEELREENPLGFPVELPVDVVARRRVRGGRGITRLRRTTTSPTAGSASTSAPRRARASPRDRGRADDLLERADGRLRVAALRRGTKAVAEAVAANGDAFSVVGGADSLRALNELGLADQSLLGLDGRRRRLELLEGKELPGVAAIPRPR